MILATSAICQALTDGAIVCDPPPARLEGAHIDVTIGNYTWLFRTDIDRYGVDIGRADPAQQFQRQYHQRHITIPARSFLLAHTQEAIGTAPGSGLLPVLHTRSTLARWGLGCHPSAGWGDEGYVSRWTLEIINPHLTAITIPVGARVGCIAFHRLEGAATPYAPGTRYNVAVADWTPEAMLPRRGNW